MALLILEGLDRTGKSSVAEHYKTKGYEVIHQSAPAKGTTADNFLEEMVDLISSAAHKDVVLDRSYYGELIWPFVYGRDSLLHEDGLEALLELERSVGTTKILMHDPNIEEHWQRCVANKEPLTRNQFITARRLYLTLVDHHGFTKKSLSDFGILSKSQSDTEPVSADPVAASSPIAKVSVLSKEQLKLETANAISDVLSKRILKNKGLIYDQLETNIRAYLNNELAKIFGNGAEVHGFNTEEVELLKFFCNKLKEGKR